MNPSGPGILLVGRFFFFLNRLFFTSSDLSFQIIYFFLIQFWWTVFLKTCPFLLGYPVGWHIIVHSILRIFCISEVSVISSPLFPILSIWVLSLFLLASLARCLSILFTLSRSLEKEMATHSSILAWRIPWTKEPGGLQSMGSQRVGHD